MSFFKVRGELRWTTISGEGQLNDLVNPPKREFVTTVIVPKNQAQSYIKELNDLWYAEGNKQPPKFLPYKELEDGTVAFRFKTNATYTTQDGITHKTIIKVFKANGLDVTTSFHQAQKKVGNGSIGVVIGMPFIYKKSSAINGITLILKAIQFIKFVPYQEDYPVEVLEVDDGLDVMPDVNNTNINNEEIPF